MTMLGANSGCTSRKEPSSTTWSMMSTTSYGWFGLSGIIVFSRRSSSVISSSTADSYCGSSARLLSGR